MKLPAVIKVSAVITAMPIWVVARMAAEGLHLPSDWRGWWTIASALSAVGMAVVEGLAFSYTFQALRQTPHLARARVLGLLIAFSAVLFVLVLMPSIAASVRGQSVNEVLSNDWALFGWAGVVAMSTIAILASVGYAELSLEKPAPPVQKQPATPQERPATPRSEDIPSPNTNRAKIRALARSRPDLSQAEIAKQLGVSPATVSRALNEIETLGG